MREVFLYGMGLRENHVVCLCLSSISGDFHLDQLWQSEPLTLKPV